MSWLIFIAVIYLLVGFLKAGAHVNSGKIGTSGPWATFIAVLLLWPFI